LKLSNHGFLLQFLDRHEEALRFFAQAKSLNASTEAHAAKLEKAVARSNKALNK
jgi:hypothetical protein